MRPSSRDYLAYAVLLAFLILPSAPAWSQSTLREDQVLVVFYAPERSDATASLLIWEAYHARYPNAHAVNLADYLLPEAELTPGTISYPDFITKIRNPIRDFLEEQSLTNEIRVILLLKDIPHRIQDWSETPNLGDNPAASDIALKEGNITYASVDSELTLLWQDLEATEKTNTRYAANFVLNPYFESNEPLRETSPVITSPFDFTEISSGKTPFWRVLDAEGLPIDESQIYLTCRLDGHTVEDVEQLIDRASSIAFDLHKDQWIFDSSSRDYDEGAYEATSERFEQAWSRQVYDASNTLLIGSAVGEFLNPDQLTTLIISGNIAFFAGFGANHTVGNQTGWLSTFRGQLVPGAIFNTYESYNGRKFGGVMAYGDHAQLSDWIHYGGTFGLGHVWEPFTFAVAHNDILLENFFYNGLTWVESAWSGIEVLSWQNVIIGDPLALAQLNHLPMVTLSGSIGGLEEDENDHPIHLSIGNSQPTDIEIYLQFSGATYGTDFVTTPPLEINDEGIGAFVLPSGTIETSITLHILADSESENLEILTADLLPSNDTDSDGFGDSYSYLSPQSVQVGIADTPYDLWRYGEFGEASLSHGSSNKDPDHDGVPNLIEYALDRNPQSPEPHPSALRFRTTFTRGSQELIFTTPASFPEDVRIVIEASSSLEPDSWTSLTSKQGAFPWTGSAPIIISSDEAESEEVRVTIEGTQRQFFRYRAEQAAPMQIAEGL